MGPDGEIPDNAVWLDLHAPTPAENRLVEHALGIALPIREEMQEIRSPAGSTSKTARAT